MIPCATRTGPPSTQPSSHFETWAKGRGAAQLRVSAYTANESALRFYRRHGFVPIDTTLTLNF
ncbi:MAG: hypothetical protein ACRDNF_04695 [Streptosporangiaceae bacterium]